MSSLDKIVIGKIVNTHGIKGELKVLPDTDFQSIRYRADQTLYIETNGKFLAVNVVKYRVHQGYDLLTLLGYNDINQVEIFKGCLLYADKGVDYELADNEFHVDELIGMTAVQSGKAVGTVIAVKPFPQGDYLEIRRTNGTTAVVPFRDEFVESVDRKTKTIVIAEMEGLL